MADDSLKFLIDADHGQFYVQDLEPYDAWMAEHAMDPDLPPAGWTDEAVHVHRIGVEPHSISVGTAWDDMVESLITIHTSAPMIESAAEHIVEVDLAAPIGQLAVSSPGVHPEDGPSMTVPLGCCEPGSPTSRLIHRPSTPMAAPAITSSIESTSGPLTGHAGSSSSNRAQIPGQDRSSRHRLCRARQPPHSPDQAC
ncbi:hypothetical protein [Kitasatospora sp. SolWspMP-SS2h]|uniref:hypothetical protein n=1 Tax=Kitasatospora sp. SolWspMP-SS2h TaxID=1305729 RepID=UPI0018F58189|nr:hypothetical protein [Kitasatospora sp. SolWspMP-SS2h]